MLWLLLTYVGLFKAVVSEDTKYWRSFVKWYKIKCWVSWGFSAKAENLGIEILQTWKNIQLLDELSEIKKQTNKKNFCLFVHLDDIS